MRAKEGFDAVDNSLRKHGGYFLAVRGAAHFTYTDCALYSKLRRFADNGSADPRLVFGLLNRYTVAFFTKYLYGEKQPLLDLPMETPSGVTFQTYEEPRTILSKIESSE